MPTQLTLFPVQVKKPDDTFHDLISLNKQDFIIKYSSRLHNGWRLEWVRGASTRCLVLPQIIKYAPATIKQAVIKWAMVVKKPKRYWSEDEKSNKKLWENDVIDYLNKPLPHLKGSASLQETKVLKHLGHKNALKIKRLNPAGKWHNLSHILDKINKEYFNNKIDAKVTWSGRVGGVSTHSISTDGKGQPFHLITVSRAYDSFDATEEIVGGVVYHECLHIVVPPVYNNSRRIVHGPDFKKREKQYRYYNIWQEWHARMLPKRVRELRREKKALITKRVRELHRVNKGKITKIGSEINNAGKGFFKFLKSLI